MAVDHKWLGGYCWDMAIALHEATNLPLYGLFDTDGVCHHAFVWDIGLQRGIDGRGMLPIEGLIVGPRGRTCAGFIPRAMSRDDIEKPGGWLGRPIDPEEVKEATRYMKRMKLLDGWQALSGIEKPARKARSSPKQ